ncbi:fibronectin type III domain-containing protein [Humisphaera borealis]|uniref:Fibronectin type III domain-containing protein n=1 Tax=Humisphaera borealis TaxID=2807512 RepID=A0A7M2WRA8_9BACT|nr:fibronectin type III domain-containing protein [Humisphaera borealis]QOV88077.1 fibronectin type III domain-containing protein [Humisphaera borealis]
MSNRQRAVPSIVMSLNSAVSRAVAKMAGNHASFESLEQRTLMAAQPTSSMAYDAAGNLHLAYYDEAAKSLKYTKQSPGGAWTTAITIDATSSDVGKMPSLSVDSAGHPGVAYFDATNEDLRYAFFNGTTWKNVAVDTKDSVGQNPSLAFDAAGTAIISYYRKTTGDLRLATLKSLAKNKWTITTVAKKGDVGQFSSLAIDPATNKPTVAFSDSAGQVQFVASGKKPVVVDTVSPDVANVDIAFGSNGRPTISYFDPASGAIKLAEAGDAKAKFFTNEPIAEVPAGSNANPTLIIDPSTGKPQVVYYDAEANGVFLAKKDAGGQEVEKEQLKAGGGEGFIATPQPGNDSISFAVVDTTGEAEAPVELANTETTPLPPTNVTAIAQSENEVLITWVDNANNETGFLVERSVDGTVWSEVAQVASDITEYVDDTAEEATTYYYRVSATGGAGETSVGTTAPRVFGSAIVTSANSTVATTTTLPKAPAALAGTPVSDSRIDLTWTDRSSAETGYVVLISTDGATWEVLATLGADSTAYSATSLPEGTTRLFAVYATRGNLASHWSQEVEVTTKPAAPSGLTVTQISTSQLNLSWTNHAAAADHVTIERSTNGTTWTTVANLTPSTATYNNTGLSEGTAYYFRVKAVGVHSSAYSNVGNGTTNPLAPSNLAATAVSPTRIDLSWTDNTTGETSYLVQRASGGGAFVTVATLDANVTTYADTGRTEGVSYSYRVKAVIGSEAQSSFSAEVSSEALPSTPTNLVAELAAAGRHVALTWTDNATGETSYEVQRLAFGSETWTTLATLASNAASYTDTSAAEATTYTYRIRAINSAGASAFSDTYVATTVPADPTGLIVSTPANDTINLSWTDNSAGETGFVVERSTDGVNFTTLTTTAASVTTYENADLASATQYTYRVKAINGAGSSGYTTTVAGTTRTDAPADLVATSVSDSQIDLAWSSVTGAQEYRVERSEDGGTTWTPIAYTETAGYSDELVDEAVAYSYRVLASNAGGLSEASSDDSVTTRPAAPTGLSAVSSDGESVSLTWSDNSGGETGYVVERSADGGTTFPTSFSVDADAESYTDTTVTEATAYVYRVRATGVGGPSAYSSNASVTTRPALPTGVVATSVSASQISIAWEDNSAGETGYRIERSANSGASWTTVATPAANAELYTDSGLSAATAYAYRVVATSTQGDSVASADSTATTRTLAPTELEAVTNSEDRIDLSWSAPAGASGFVVYRSLDGVNYTSIATLGSSELTYSDTGLTEATDYYFEVVATNAGGESAAAGTFGTTKPLAPDTVSVQANSATSVTVTWSDNSAGEDGYYVEVSTDGGSTFSDAGQVLADVETLNVTVAEGTSPVFRVRAIKSGVFSPYSETATTDTIPAAPSAVAVNSVSAASLSVTWADNSANETGFRIERSTDGINFVQVGTADAGETTFTDTGLDEGTEYTYRVRATMGVSRNSAYSDTDSAVTRPAAPTGLNAALVVGGVDLTWTNLSVNADSYVIERSSNDGDTWSQIGTANTTSYSDTTTSAGLSYLYRVLSVNEGGASVASSEAAATLVPNVPQNVTATLQAGGDDVTVSWTDTAGETGYSLYRSDDGGSNWSLIATLPAGETSHDDAVSENAEYQYRVRAFNGSGESVDSAEAIVNTTLVPASGVAATATPTSVTVTWDDNSSGEAGYSVQRSSNGGNSWTQVGTAAANAETYTDSTVAQGTSYRYRVTATNGLVVSTPSSSTTIITRLAVPTGLTATSPSSSQIDLSWTDNATNHLGVQILKSSDGVNFTQVDFVNAGTHTWSDTGLDEASTYQYKVRAASAIATSDPTSAVVGLVRPSAPSQLEATVESDTAITLTWTDTSAGATGFTIEISDDGGSNWAVAGTTNGATTFADTGLTEGTTYVYRVAATNASGASTVVGLTATTNPAAPTGLSVTAASPTQVDLSWTNVSASDTTVRIERSEDSGPFTTLASVAASENTYSDTSAVEGTDYAYRVVAVYLSDSAASNTDTVTTPPSAATALQADVLGDTSIDVTWTDTSAHETEFRIERSTDGVNFTSIATQIPNYNFYTDNSGVEGTSYTYRIVTVQDSLETTSATITAQTAPAAPSGLSAASPAAGTVNLTWSDNSANETGFIIERSDDGDEFAQIGTADAGETTYSDTTVAAGSTHYYRVLAVQGINSAPTGEVTGVSRPAAPANFAVTALSPTTSTVAWDAVTGATGYTIEISTDAGSNWTQAGTTTFATSFDDTGLTESDDYVYRVIATNAGGASVASATVNIHTLPAAPTDLVATASIPTQVNLAWTDNSTSGVADILVYRALGELPAENDFSLLTTLSPGSESYSDTTVQGGLAYTYKLVADDGDAVNGNVTDSVTTPPAAVTALNAVSSTPTTVDISWTASNGATTYTVERSTDGVNFAELAEVQTNSYSDETAVEATEYTYRVTPTGAGGDGPTATDVVTTLPAAVTTITVSGYTATSVDLAWTDPSAGETGFRIERSTDGENWTTLTTTAADAETYTDSTAVEATTYAYRAVPVGSGGDGSAAVADVTTLPATPTGAVATGVSSTQVDLAWNDNSAGEQSYTILRSVSGGGYTVLASGLDAGTESYSDTTVQPGTAYAYKLVAEGVGGSSAESSAATVTTVPSEPADVTATMTSITEVAIAWTDVSGNTSYRIERKAGNGAFAEIVNSLGADATSYDDETAVEGTSYVYRVFAVNAGGDSAPSSEAAVTTAPAGPSNLAASDTDATTIHLTWDDNSSGETSITVQRFDDSAWVTIATLDTDTESYDDTVATGSTHTYRVFASNTGGDSALSGTASATTVPAQVTGVTAVASGTTTVDVAWSLVSGATGYRVYRSDDAGANFSQLGTDLDDETASFEDATATEATAYVYRVEAFNASGAGAVSGNAAVATPPIAPTSLIHTAASTSGIDLQWVDNSAHETGFLVQHSTDGGTTWEDVGTVADVDGTGDTTSLTDNDVVEGATYQYRVRALFGDASSAWTSVHTADTEPEYTTNLAVASFTNTAVSLTWTDNSAGEAGFSVHRSGDGGTTWTTLATLDPNTTAYTDSTAVQSTAYLYRIRTFRGDAEGYTSNVSVTTRPTAATGLAATATSPTSVDLEWTDNATAEDGYKIERSVDGGTNWSQIASIASGSESYTDSSAPESATTSYRVIAYKGAIDSAASTADTVTTPVATPSGLAVTATSHDAVSLSWTDNSGAETGQRIERSTDGGNTWSALVTVAVDAVSYSDTTVSEDTAYSYRIVALVGEAESNGSAADDVTTPLAMPTTLAATSPTATSVALTWTNVSTAAEDVVIERSADAGSNWTTVATIAASNDDYTDSTVTEGTAYLYRISAVKTGNASATTGSVAVTTLPAAPTGVSTTSITTTGLTVTWTDNAAGEDGFEVEVSTDGGDTWSTAGTADDVAGTGDTGSLVQTGLTEGSTYVYRVRATSGGRLSAWSSTHTVDTRPVAPSALAVTTFTDTVVNLAWTDNSAGETSVEVDRTTDGGNNWTTIATLAADAVSYSDTGRTQSSEYVYRVRAVRGTSASAYTSDVTVTTRPTAASGLTATAATPTSINLAWTDNASAEDGYKIERSVDGGENWTEIAQVAADAESYTDALAPESATASYRVIAYKGLIDSALSNEDSATTPVAIPNDLAVSATSHNAVGLSWTDNSDANDSQRIERSTDGGTSWSTLASVGANESTYSDTTVVEDTAYAYRIVSLVGEAESTPSASDDVTTPLAMPTALAAASPTATSVELTWTNVSTAAEDVVIERSADAGANWSTLATIDAVNDSYTDSTVSEGSAYQYRIHAIKTGNASSTTAAASVITLPATPTSFDATVFSLSQIDLAWNDNAGSETGYRIERSENGGAYSELVTVAGDVESYSDTSVHEGGTFAYLVYALGAGGNSATATDTAITAPADPSGFTVTPVTATRIDVAWSDNSSGETSYVLQRSTDGGSTWSALATLDPNTTSYSDTSVTEATTYDYRVRGVRSSAVSGWVAGDATTVPATPTGLVATVPAGTPRVNLAWNDNSAGENGVQVERSEDGGTNWTLLSTAAANATSYSDTTVVEGTTYQYRIRATSAAGNSTWATSVTASTLPATPTGLSATAISYNQVNLAWTDNSARENGFLVERSIGGVTWSSVATLAADTVSYSDTAVGEGFTYQYRVRATTAAVNGSPSGTASATTPVAAPTNLAATAVSTTQVNLTWTDNSAVESNYKIERSTDGGSTFSALTTVVAGSTSYSDTTATAGTTYVYRVRATKGAILSTYATSSAVTTAPTAPSNLAATAASHSDVNLTWTDAQGETAYTIERSANAGSTWSTLTTAVAANATTYTDTTATEETAYLYRIRATNAAGSSANVTSASVTTLPAAPADVVATSESSDTISLSWTDVSSAESGYKIERQIESSGNWVQIATVGGNVTSYVDPTCDESVAYEYRVRATSGPRNSAYSNTTVATTIPFPPDSLVVTATSASSISLQWTNPSNAPTMVIERSTDGGDTFTAIGTTGQGGTTYTNTGLSADTTYVYRIRAYNGDGGFSDPTNTVVAATDAE